MLLTASCSTDVIGPISWLIVWPGWMLLRWRPSGLKILVIQEAFLHGRPIIAPRLGGMAEKISHQKTGLLFECGNRSDLAEQCIRLWSDQIAGFSSAERQAQNVNVQIRLRCTSLFTGIGTQPRLDE